MSLSLQKLISATGLSRRLARGSFACDAAIVTMGTLIAQSITVLASPILTRLYAPEDYGLFALFMGISSVLAIAATARYETAILLPEQDHEAMTLVLLSASLALVVSLGVLVAVVAAGRPLATALGNPGFVTWLLAIPLFILVTGVQQTLRFWANRKQQYAKLAINDSILACGAATLAFSLSGVGAAGLLIGSLGAQAFATALLAWQTRADLADAFHSGQFSAMKEKASRYRNFPKFSLPADCLNTAAQQAPNVLLNAFFGPAVAGSFSLTQRVLSMPFVLLGQSIGRVFRQRACSQFHLQGNCRDVFSKTFKSLLLLSLIPFPLLLLGAPWLFSIVFGEQWRTAGEYASMLAPLFLVRFLSSPLTYMFFLREKQHYDLLGVAALLAVSVSSMFIGKSLGSPKVAIALFSAMTCVVYLLYLLVSMRLANGEQEPTSVAREGAMQV